MGGGLPAEPPRRALAIDVAGAATNVESTPGDVPFAFAGDRHREVVLDDKAALLEFVEETTKGPRHEVTRRDAESYVRDRLTADDPEWRAVVKQPAARSWLGRLASQIDEDE